jgi:dihydrofolate synthase/folylpolyglutamate synthase
MSTYPESVQYLYSLGNEVKSLKLGLDRIVAVLGKLGNPETFCPWVHVAGTNGKGSTCAMIESGLRASGRRTGLFTSPHLVEPTERIKIDGVSVTPQQFAGAFDRVHDVAKQMDMHTTYFETVAAMAFLIFRELKIDMGVIEVGLGGRLDATNVIPPKLCVITSIDYDHEQWLGHDIRQIAAEKAGIMKRGVPVVIARQAHAEAARVLEETANRTGAEAIRTVDWEIRDLKVVSSGSSFVASHGGELDVECNLAGRHQVDNALTAAIALRQLGIDRAAIETGISAARWPCRLERVSTGPEILLDGAHNPAGAKALAAHIQEFYTGRRVWMIYATMKDKSIHGTAEALFPLAHELIFTAANSSRSMRPEDLMAMFPQWKAKTAPCATDALAMVGDANADDLVVITGSLFLAGEVRKLLLKE